MYKIIFNDYVIDVIKYPRFLRFLSHNRTIFTDMALADGILGSDQKTIYAFTPDKKPGVKVVKIEKIATEEAFIKLKESLAAGDSICADTSKVTIAKQAKIQALSEACKKFITNGFSIKLSDGNDYHFKLTTEDQLNLAIIENQLLSGEIEFIYHATNQPCRVYTKEDMLTVIKAYKRHILYHTTYFNALKQYVKKLSDLEQINTVRYGTDVLDSVEDNAIRCIIKSKGAIL